MTQKLQEELLQNNAKDIDNGHYMEDIFARIEKFHSTIGFRASTEETNSSGILLPSALVAAATWKQILEVCSNLFSAMGVTSATDKVWQWHNSVRNLHEHDPPLIDDLQGLMVALKQNYGFHIAICTSDDRSSTDSSIKNWNLSDAIDYSICGNEVSNGKPSAEPLLTLCNQAGVEPSECIVVGDTTSDTGMAKNAGAGLMIGVLSGSGMKDQLLATGATVVLKDVGKIPEFLELTKSK
eukprot:CAMPEP_0178910002 /NCGR_PEP_ID=MMETSP0786-20121207/8852_1 /TAXON_ID=186022 /ORGANISM="Thalassionema frauenfeldii, Strain CCMP 1798" /LENGTH=238 /DNA_ID=CAMNT_0020582199 /DNA_START=135 /DNA_END=851 /DNA_ORIENTATION=-